MEGARPAVPLASTTPPAQACQSCLAIARRRNHHTWRSGRRRWAAPLVALGALPLARAQSPLADGKPVLGGGGLGTPPADTAVSFANHHVDDESADRAHAAAWSTADGAASASPAADQGWTPRDTEVGLGITSSAGAAAAEAESVESTVEVRQRLQESICRQEAAHDLQQSLEVDVSEKIRSEFLPGAPHARVFLPSLSGASSVRTPVARAPSPRTRVAIARCRRRRSCRAAPVPPLPLAGFIKSGLSPVARAIASPFAAIIGLAFASGPVADIMIDVVIIMIITGIVKRSMPGALKMVCGAIVEELVFALPPILVLTITASLAYKLKYSLTAVIIGAIKRCAAARTMPFRTRSAPPRDTGARARARLSGCVRAAPRAAPRAPTPLPPPSPPPHETCAPLSSGRYMEKNRPVLISGLTHALVHGLHNALTTGVVHSTAAPLTHALSTSLTSSLVHFYYCTYCYYYHDYCRYCQRWESYTQVRRAATSVRLASGGDAAIPASFSPWSLTLPSPPIHSAVVVRRSTATTGTVCTRRSQTSTPSRTSTRSREGRQTRSSAD